MTCVTTLTVDLVANDMQTLADIAARRRTTISCVLRRAISMHKAVDDAQPLAHDNTTQGEPMPQLPTLYALADEMGSLVVRLSQADTPEQVDALLAEIAGVESDLNIKSDRCIGLMREFELRAQARSAEAARIKALAEADNHKAERLKAYVLDCLQSAHQDSVETTRFRIRVQNNPTSVEITDEHAVPTSFMIRTETYAVDKTAIRKWTETTGEIVPGTRLVKGKHLRVS